MGAIKVHMVERPLLSEMPFCDALSHPQSLITRDHLSSLVLLLLFECIFYSIPQFLDILLHTPDTTDQIPKLGPLQLVDFTYNTIELIYNVLKRHFSHYLSPSFPSHAHSIRCHRLGPWHPR